MQDLFFGTTSFKDAGAQVEYQSSSVIQSRYVEKITKSQSAADALWTVSSQQHPRLRGAKNFLRPCIQIDGLIFLAILYTMPCVKRLCDSGSWTHLSTFSKCRVTDFSTNSLITNICPSLSITSALSERSPLIPCG